MQVDYLFEYSMSKYKQMDNNHENESITIAHMRELCAQRCRVICFGMIFFALFSMLVIFLAAVIAERLHGSE